MIRIRLLRQSHDKQITGLSIDNGRRSYVLVQRRIVGKYAPVKGSMTVYFGGRGWGFRW